jgi:hypothetical protein
MKDAKKGKGTRGEKKRKRCGDCLISADGLKYALLVFRVVLLTIICMENDVIW